jgi:uncharacterized protein
MALKAERAVAIFSKTPQIGKVKTRMRPVLSDAQCLELHLALLQDALALVQTIPGDAFLYLSESGDPPFASPIPIRFQKGADLGQRMENAFRELLHQYKTIVMIGIDSPAMPGRTLEQAFELLGKNELVFGPAEDGGYYLIGMNVLVSEVFRKIDWGTPAVLEQSQKAVSGRSYALLDRCYDIDVPSDLEHLRQDLAARPIPAPYVRQWFEKKRLTHERSKQNH